MISFGPVPSRRLGKSLGINNIPAQKVCSYSCIYCQVGATKKQTIERQTFYKPSVIYHDVESRLAKLKESDKPDFLTFVANGEPTLDINLGKSIDLLKSFGIPIAVITNASLLSSSRVRADLMTADWVSVKIDTADKAIWRTINRPFAGLHLEQYKEGLMTFSQDYQGKLVSETMLVKAVTDTPESLSQTAELVARVNPEIAYISIPTRPPAVASVTAPDENVIIEAYQKFISHNLHVELVLDFEGTDTGYTGNAYEDILNMCAVHPIREDTMLELLKKDNSDSSVVDILLHNQLIQKVIYKENAFYIRKYR